MFNIYRQVHTHHSAWPAQVQVQFPNLLLAARQEAEILESMSRNGECDGM